jgi:peptidoglycan LD-endopeptidase LytH
MTVRRPSFVLLITAACLLSAAPAASAADGSSAAEDVRLAAADAPPAAAAATYTFPVQPPSAASYGRDHHDYPATDIFAACGTRVVSPTAGVVLEVSRTDRWDPAVNDGATRGGLSVTVFGDDGVRYYGSHYATIARSIEPGVRVTAGQTLGTVGRTGSARPTPCHLHFGVSPPCGFGDWEVRRGVVWTWPYLDSWKAGGSRSPAAEVAAWRAANPTRCRGGEVFHDVDPTSTHGPAIERLHRDGVTRGCGPYRYCPVDPVTRAQIASFLQRALGLPPGPTGGFTDVAPSSTHAAAIGALRQAGITLGCTSDGRSYCPGDAIRRDQLASFLQRALGLPAGPRDRFTDVAPSSTHAAAIGAVDAVGITRGCDAEGRRYCPADRVNRAQMASFVSRTMDHRGG